MIREENRGMTKKQWNETKRAHTKEEERIQELLKPFLAEGVRVEAPHVPAGEGITLTHFNGGKIVLTPIGDDMTFLQVDRV